MKRPMAIRSTDRFLVFFLLGITAGTIMANLLGQSIGKETGFYGGGFTYGLKLTKEQQLTLFASVCRQRGVEIGFAWLAGLTVFAIPCFSILSTYYGITAGVLLSITTFQKGLMGIPCYLFSLLPHYLMYIPVWCILAVWASQPSRKIRFIPLLGIGVLVLLGALLEAYVNPGLLGLLVS